MAAVLLWVRHDLRRGWRRLVVLALLAAFASGVVLAATAGARRGMSTVDRLLAETRPADAIIPANQPGFDWEAVRELPEVEELGLFPLGPAFWSPDLPGDEWDAMGADDDQLFITFERPVVAEGRMYDPAADDEAIVTPWFQDHFGKGVGDTIEIRLASSAREALEFFDTGDPEGLTGDVLHVRIVGVVRGPLFSDSAAFPKGQATLSPGVMAAHPESWAHFPGTHGVAADNAVVRLVHGPADLPRLRRDLERLGHADVDVWGMEDRFWAPARASVAFEGRSLLTFGAAAFLAALVLVGQAVSRATAAAGDDLAPSRSLGMTPVQRVLAAGLPSVLASLLGAMVGAATAAAGSTHFPIGTAAGLEPHPGADVDWLILGPGVLGAVLLAAAFAAWGGVRQVRVGSRQTPRVSAIAAAAARASVPVPVVVGTRFALEAGHGPRSVPVRPALLGCTVGVLGVVAALVISHGIDDAIDHPERFGQTQQASAFIGEGDRTVVPAGKTVDSVADLDYVTGVNDSRQGVATVAGGAGSITLWSYDDDSPKPLPTVVLDGRMPETADEILLAKDSADALHASIGDAVGLTGAAGTATYHVSGVGFLPIGAHNGYTDGGWVTDRGYDAVLSGFKFRQILVSTSTADGLAALQDDLPDLGFEAPDTASTVAQLQEVRRLPLLLGLFLAVLAVGAVGHALVTAVRRRALDLAVLRAVGLTPGQSRGVVVVQATVVVLVGLAFGVPLGLAAGRAVWRVIADLTPLAYEPPSAALVLALVGPAALAVAYLMATWPAVRASRIRVAAVLRAE